MLQSLIFCDKYSPTCFTSGIQESTHVFSNTSRCNKCTILNPGKLSIILYCHYFGNELNFSSPLYFEKIQKKDRPRRVQYNLDNFMAEIINPSKPPLGPEREGLGKVYMRMKGILRY